MELFQAVKSCFTKYATFSGRASRSEYWYFQLFLISLSLLIGLVDAIIMLTYQNNYNILRWVLSLATFLPNLAVLVRRLHDVNRSGWWILIPLTIVGMIPLMYWSVKESDLGPNRFGEDPLETLDKKRTEKNASKQALSLTLFVFLSFFILTAMLIWVGVPFDKKSSLNMEVVSGEYLLEENYQSLLSSQIVQEDDSILYFYSEGKNSIMEGGQLLTENGVIIYEKNNGQLIKYDMLYKDIEAVELLEKGTGNSDSIYQITGNENAKYDYITIFLSTKSGGDQLFIEELNRRIGHK